MAVHDADRLAAIELPLLLAIRANRNGQGKLVAAYLRQMATVLDLLPAEESETRQAMVKRLSERAC